MLKSTNISYDIVAISETRILTLKKFNFEYTPGESTAGRTMLYIPNHLPYKPRHDLKNYKTNELESTFIEFINLKLQNVSFVDIHL